ncbi:protein lin-37 homolog [Diorhabda carinulata]|uniref:protein lin-37 homolog n=1 Tax=Diorhabda sublineata TaxID=1163346 RepID=UPI0024E07BC6|nr:protein lin-37 homolog [Diorhabda sublineata]XP_057658217.1 protein lin-37 homolog [Diorhabda carinulata]
MTKKRRLSNSSPIKVEVKEENTIGNDYLLAKGRLKGVLKQLTEQSSDEGSDSSDDNKKLSESNRKRKVENMPTPYHHTYVMKLFDRSVDLARFEEDTPLYPICRAWMQNQPRNPQSIVKRRLSSPEPANNSWNENSLSEINRLPSPHTQFVSRIPSPLPEQEQNKDNINLDYDEYIPSKHTLMQEHMKRWMNVKKKWIQTAFNNENRYLQSTNILKAIYNKAQEESN